METKRNLVNDLIYKELAYRIVGCFYEVYNTLGPGHKEVVYHRALSKEFKLKDILFEEEKQLSASYKGENVGFYVPDFVIENKVIVEIKAVEIMPNAYEKKLYYYLKGSEYKLGYLVNFGNKLEIRRRIYDKIRNAN